MADVTDFDLGAMLSSIKPSIVSPKLNEITGLNNDKKLRKIAELIVTSMVDEYNKNEHKVNKLIMHNGEATEVRYINIEPLLSGVWPAMSLMLLQLSYGEQTVLIDAIYPKQAQFTAKTFAAVFTQTPDIQTSSGTLEVKADTELSKKIDSSNAGIAMILSMLRDRGYREPHPDKVTKEMNKMDDLVEEAAKELNFRSSTKRAQDAMKSRDM